MAHDEPVADYVLGALHAAQRDVVARRRLYDRALDCEICALEALLAGLAPQQQHPASGEALWLKVCDGVAHEHSLSGSGAFACLAGAWDPHGPGIETKALWSDKAMLIRCEPGAFDDAHEQPADEDEHIIVIGGDLVIGTRKLFAGDYLCIPAAALHGRMHTMSGCLIFTQYVPADKRGATEKK
jgi:hypothetical protein